MRSAPYATRRRGLPGLRLVLAVLAAALLGGATVPPASAEAASTAAAAPSFSDVPENHPFYDDIEWMATFGISEGYADGTYRPAAAVSRQAMAAFMYRFAFTPDFTPPATPTFSDVPTSSPFYAEVEWMADAAISEGFSDGTFRPAAPVSRQAMSAFLFRLMDGGDYAGPLDPTFADVPTSSPFYDSVEWMGENGISVGYTSGGTTTFRPTATVTRQAMSAFMYRADDLIG